MEAVLNIGYTPIWRYLCDLKPEGIAPAASNHLNTDKEVYDLFKPDKHAYCDWSIVC